VRRLQQSPDCGKIAKQSTAVFSLHQHIIMKTPDLTPAQRVIAAFGGVRETARVLDRNASSVSRWQLSKAEGGTDGRIPSGVQARVLAEAKARGLDLSPGDLIAGW
jgi:hypothetical protein